MSRDVAGLVRGQVADRRRHVLDRTSTPHRDYVADLVLIDPNKPFRVEPSNVLYKCGWSPFEGHEFSSTIDTTIVNGQVVYRDGQLTGVVAGQRLEFNRSR